METTTAVPSPKTTKKKPAPPEPESLSPLVDPYDQYGRQLISLALVEIIRWQLANNKIQEGVAASMACRYADRTVDQAMTISRPTIAVRGRPEPVFAPPLPEPLPPPAITHEPAPREIDTEGNPGPTMGPQMA